MAGGTGAVRREEGVSGRRKEEEEEEKDGKEGEQEKEEEQKPHVIICNNVLKICKMYYMQYCTKTDKIMMYNRRMN